MQPLASAMVLFSVLFPVRHWYPPDQPLVIEVKADVELSLVLTDFLGKVIDPIDASRPPDFSRHQSVDLLQFYPQLGSPGTFLLYAVPKGKQVTDFIGTPLVIRIRQDRRRDAPPDPIVTHITPLCYAIISTSKGDMKLAFYYDVAPNTVASFIDLAREKFYDGLLFHRVVPDFLIQGGDPVGFDPVRADTGGPGFEIDAEFNDRRHVEGVISMAREDDPLERQGALPRPQWANSAGSQFFICLNYRRTQQLDRRYTAFGRVFEGMDVVQQIGKLPVDPQRHRPLEPPLIKQIQIVPVDAANNPYPTLLTGASQAPAIGEAPERSN